MEDLDLGQRSSYLVVGKGVPVYSSDGEEVGRVVTVRTDAKDDIFDGIVFSASLGPGGNRFVDAPEVGEIYERGVILKIDAADGGAAGQAGSEPGRARGLARRRRRRAAAQRPAALLEPAHRQGLSRGRSSSGRNAPAGPARLRWRRCGGSF